ncbi:ATP-binding protein [Bacteriovoracaceae bacterium]|nr:ATP-binding protein [Bacteriovoracaceae bacterium]
MTLLQWSKLTSIKTVNFFLPPQPNEGKFRLFIGFTLVYLLTNGISLPLLINRPIVLAIVTVSMFLFSLLLYRTKRNANYVTTVRFATSILILQFSSNCLVSGGVHSHAIIWLILIPFAVTLLGSFSDAKKSAYLILFIYLGFYIGETNGFQFTSEASSIDKRTFAVTKELALTTIVLLCLSALYDNRNRILLLKNKEKSINIKSMLDSLPQIIFSVFTNGEIKGEHSKKFDELFKNSISHLDQLLPLTDLNNEENEIILNCINLSLNESQLHFDTNRHLLPHRLNMVFEDDSYIFEIDWTPVPDSNSIIRSILISMKDITEFEMLKNKSEKQKKDIERLIELLGNPLDTIRNNLTILESLVIEAISASSFKDEKHFCMILRDIHTVKGNSRMLNLSDISLHCHNIEQKIVKIDSKSKEPIEKYLLELSQTIEQYIQIYDSKLGSTIHSNEIRIPLDIAKLGIQKLKQMEQELGPFYDVLSEQLENTLKAVLKPVISSIPRISKQLGKHTPQIEYLNGNGEIPQRYNVLFINVFNHLVRNSLDHGLEPSIDRKTYGKDPQGKLKIRFETTSNHIEIQFSDDGRGLNTNRIIEVMNRTIETKKTWSTVDICEAIFRPEFTTKSVVTDFSGRGFGMDAVKEYIEGMKGSVEILTDIQGTKIPSFIPFVVQIKLPR